MRELILHIGPTKTGSSYLQRMFLENREGLRRAGLIMGPGQDPKTGSHLPLLERMNSEGISAVMPEIVAVPGDRIFLSAEDFNQFFTEAAPNGRPWTEEFLDAVRGHFDLRIVFVIRRQDHLKESRFSEAVKGSFHGDIRDLGALQRPHALLDLDSRIAALEAAFGKEAMTVVPHSSRNGDDLMDSFLQALGIVLDPADRRDVPPQNVAGHRRKVLFMSQIPKHPLAAVNRRYWFPASFIARVVTRSKSIHNDGGRHLLSPAERHALVASHHAGNLALVARYDLSDPGDFLDLPDPDAPWSPPATITWGEFISVWREVVAAALGENPPLPAFNVAARSSALFARMGWSVLAVGARRPSDGTSADGRGVPAGPGSRADL